MNCEYLWFLCSAEVNCSLVEWAQMGSGDWRHWILFLLPVMPCAPTLPPLSENWELLSHCLLHKWVACPCGLAEEIGLTWSGFLCSVPFPLIIELGKHKTEKYRNTLNFIYVNVLMNNIILFRKKSHQVLCQLSSTELYEVLTCLLNILFSELDF